MDNLGFEIRKQWCPECGRSWFIMVPPGFPNDRVSCPKCKQKVSLDLETIASVRGYEGGESAP